ncbi:carbohydrate ABC transporter permease [Tumebacillus permanentifrigoris]|uniref:Carbohydrate ABC transporter membrane protein 1 (CUT1 family) n=1 Tax=Tumebacillus permanentifrigoris TaxID=378543 RepID=A0A316DDK9_9BACL|nr:sugar ABC transporter permease [Tumebacillus permanentifrigoris]PWK16317.1 carbohydrate ABC transporter membrane protein 1 (CUT1 family) [Tumebacillus permanentifrigoris]
MRTRGDLATGYLFVLPVVVSLAVFLIGPILYALYISFHHFSFLAPDQATFAGLDNYLKLFKDPRFIRALGNTSLYSLGVVPIQIAIALMLALIVDAKIKGKTLFRVVYFLPTVTSTVAVSVMFMYLFKNDGLVNFVLSKLSIPTFDWFNSLTFALPAVMMMAIWTTVGQFMVIYLAGLQDIPQELYEAAEVDGATPWQRLRFITWPMLKPTTFFILIMSIIGTFQVFDQMYVISKGEGGPQDRTLTVVFYLYRAAFKDFDMGYASAMAFALFLIILLLTIIQRKFFKEETN